MTDEVNDKPKKPEHRTGQRTTIVAVFVAALLVLDVSAQTQTITGKVVGVSDGDTITLLDDQKRQRDREAKKPTAKKASKKGSAQVQRRGSGGRRLA